VIEYLASLSAKDATEYQRNADEQGECHRKEALLRDWAEMTLEQMAERTRKKQSTRTVVRTHAVADRQPAHLAVPLTV